MTDELVTMYIEGITIQVPVNEVTFYKNAGYKVVSDKTSKSGSGGKPDKNAPAPDSSGKEQAGG